MIFAKTSRKKWGPKPQNLTCIRRNLHMIQIVLSRCGTMYNDLAPSEYYNVGMYSNNKPPSLYHPFMVIRGIISTPQPVVMSWNIHVFTWHSLHGLPMIHYSKVLVFIPFRTHLLFIWSYGSFLK